MHIKESAMMIALNAHHGVVNKHNGEPYILHVARVALACEYAGLDDKHIAVAWLHDAVEDTDLTIAELHVYFPDAPEVVQAVSYLTKIPGEANRDYYERLRECQMAARVKIRDIHDNFSRNHLIEDDEPKRLRMAAKYSLGLDILREFV